MYVFPLFSRTIPLRPDDYQRFKPEYWLQNHNPNPVAFTDLAVLQSELELKRRRELHRQNSQKAAQNSQKAAQNSQPPSSAKNSRNSSLLSPPDGQENNFNSLPWEEIIPRRVGGVPVLPAEHEIQQQNRKDRSKSQDARKSNRGNCFLPRLKSTRKLDIRWFYRKLSYWMQYDISWWLWFLLCKLRA